MADGSLPRTRLIDRLCAVGWSKRVVLPEGTEKLCQLITERLLPAAFCVVTTRELPWRCRKAAPWIAWAPVGWPKALVAPMKAAATASATPAGRKPATAGLGAAAERCPVNERAFRAPAGRQETGLAGFFT